MEPLNSAEGFGELLPLLLMQTEIERETDRRASALLSPGSFSEREMPGDMDGYLSRNVFSLLFLAIYKSLGVKEERIRFYGMVNHAVRGLVTATDNLLDDEDKPLLPLRLPRGAARFTAVMNILLFDRVLAGLLDDFKAAEGVSAEEPGLFSAELMKALYAIGEVEAEEEEGLQKIAPPEEILSRVHPRRGGDLLALAFIAPTVFEKTGREKLLKAKKAVYGIGLSLQLVDDIVDLAEDAKAGKNNYLLALMLSVDPSPGLMKTLEDGWEAAYRLRPETVRQSFKLALEKAHGGFALLSEIGMDFDRPRAALFINELFRLRGCGGLMELLG